MMSLEISCGEAFLREPTICLMLVIKPTNCVDISDKQTLPTVLMMLLYAKNLLLGELLYRLVNGIQVFFFALADVYG
jgi:hypothetical protein